MAQGLVLRGSRYYIHRNLGGVHYRISTGCLTLAAATEEYRRFEVDPRSYVSPLGRAAWKTPGRGGRSLREAHLRRRHGLSIADRQRLFDAQGGRCRICECLEADRRTGRLHVDHCHRTGVIRGLLCQQCNHALGLMSDSPELLRRAAEYLERSRVAA